MAEGLLLVIAFVITFFMGFFICIGAFPFLLSFLAKRVKTWGNRLDENSVFQWSVAFIVAFTAAMIICSLKA